MKKKLFKIYLDIMQMLQGVSQFVFIVASLAFLIDNSDLLSKFIFLEFGIQNALLLIFFTFVSIALAVSIGNLAIKEFFSFLMPSFLYDTSKVESISVYNPPVKDGVSTLGQLHRSNIGIGGSWENNDNNSGAIHKNFFSQLNTPALNKKLEAYTKEVQRLEDKVWNLSYEIEIKSYILFMVGDAIHNFREYNLALWEQKKSNIDDSDVVVSRYHAEIISSAGSFLRAISKNSYGWYRDKLDAKYDGFEYGNNQNFNRDSKHYTLTQIDNILFVIDILMKAAHNMEFKEHEVVMIEKVLDVKKTPDSATE